jgi:hypothetical protein
MLYKAWHALVVKEDMHRGLQCEDRPATDKSQRGAALTKLPLSCAGCSGLWTRFMEDFLHWCFICSQEVLQPGLVMTHLISTFRTHKSVAVVKPQQWRACPAHTS